MNTLNYLINFILHLDQHLIAFVTAYGAWTYALLFFIIFCESGIIFTAFLPGDSLLFATGALTASMKGVLNIHALFILLETGLDHAFFVPVIPGFLIKNILKKHISFMSVMAEKPLSSRVLFPLCVPSYRLSRA